jgi:hypothetical protein
MFDIAEIQNALQKPSVQLSDLMKLANGSNSAVPGWAALMELNRRKQLEATNTAFNASPPTIKDQLTNAPPAVNPTAAPTGIAPAGAPQLASAVAAPPRMNVAAAPANQVNPTVPPQLAAEGGLLSIPTPHMFKQESYATGGIVAFSGTDDSFVDPKLVPRPTFLDKLTGKAKAKQEKFDKQSQMLAADYSGDASDLELPANAPPHPYAIEKFLNDEQRAARRKVEGTDVNHPSPDNPAENKRQDLLKAKAAQAAADKARLDALVTQIPTWHTGSDGTIKGTKPVDAAAPVEEKGVVTLPHEKTRNKPVDDFNKIPDAGIPTVAPVVAAPVAPAAPAPLPPVKVTDTTRTPYKTLTAEERQAAVIQQADNNKILREKFGISDDPHKADRERMDKLEAKRDGQEKEDSKNELINFLAKASQSQKQNFFAAMGEGAESTGKLTKENAALRDKQAVEMLAARQAMATADDARKRGDMATAVAAEKEAETRKEKAAELGNQFDATTAVLQQADAATTNATTGITNADTGRINADTQKALIPSHQKTADAAMLQSESHWYQVHHPQASEATIKQAMVQRFMKKYGIDEEQAISRIAIAQGAGKVDLLEDRNAQANGALYDKEIMVRNQAKKDFGQDGASNEVIRQRWLKSRAPGSTPESSGRPTTKAEYDKLPKGALYTDPNGVPRNKS